MVFQPVGLRQGSTQADPTSSYSIPDAYLRLHTGVGSHGQSYTIRPSDVRRNVRVTIQNQSVKNFDSAAFGVQSDNMFDVEMTGAPVHTLIDLYLHFRLFNTLASGGNNIKPMAPFAFFARQEVMANGSFADDTIYSEQAYHDYFYWLSGDTERAHRARSLLMETKDRPQNDTNTRTVETMFDEAATGIEPQESQEYFYPLINFMTTSSLWLPTKLVDPKIRLYSRQNPIVSTNDVADLATAQLRFQGMEVIYFGLLYDPTIRMKISEVMRSCTHYTRTLVHDRLQTTINSIATGTYLSDIQLTPFMGEYAKLLFYFTRNDATIEGQIYGCNRSWTTTRGSPLDIGVMTFNDSSGYAVFYNDFPTDALRYCVEGSLNKYPGVYGVKPYVPIYFCSDPTLTMQSGISSGGMAMDGNFIIKAQLKPFTAGATTSVTATVLGSRYAILQCESNGSYVLLKL